MGNDNSVIDDFEDTDFKIRTITPQDEAEFLRDRNDKKHQVIELNIGGKHYTTLLSTLEKAKPKKPLTSLFTHKDKDGRYFLDRDWEPFEIIIEALRTGDPLELPSDPEARNKLISEVKFFGMEEYFKNDLEVGKFIGGTLLSAADKKQIHQWVGNPNHNWKLIFKATRDGFSNFRNKCTLQGETITVIQTTGGYLFGGYAPIDWTKNIGYSYDHRTFLFTLKVPGGQRIKIPNNGPYAGHAYSIYVCFSTQC